MSFFPEGVATPRPKSLTVLTSPRCDLCKYCKTANTPVQPPRGAGKLMIVGEYPDTTADLVGKPLSGGGLSLLSSVLSKAGLSLDDVVYVNALACRPDVKNGEKDLGAAVGHCRPTVWDAIKAHKPKVIVPMGDLAVKSLLAPFRAPGDNMAATRWAGYQIPLAELKAWVCPTLNPSAAHLRASLEVKKSRVYSVLIERHLKGAVALLKQDRPAKCDPKAGLEIVEEAEAVAFMEAITFGTMAFDFETTGLKPDRKDQRIVCCSVCWRGDETISFMWTPAVAKALRRVLQDKAVGKIASNLMFEARWCMAKLGTRVANWRWDTMQAAHVIDARGDNPEEGVTSIKFQAFALFGVLPWDQEVKPYLSSGKGGANGLNRVPDVDRRKLLTYCGIDSRMEYLVAARQAALLNLSLEDWK